MNSKQSKNFKLALMSIYDNYASSNKFYRCVAFLMKCVKKSDYDDQHLSDSRILMNQPKI